MAWRGWTTRCSCRATEVLLSLGAFFHAVVTHMPILRAGMRLARLSLKWHVHPEACIGGKRLGVPRPRAQGS